MKEPGQNPTGQVNQMSGNSGYTSWAIQGHETLHVLHFSLVR